tara:strand:- start:35 stop:1462 length:1428 start_codon:yes stop_codon:yes gene_type:complete
MFKSDQVLMEKWAPVLDHESAPIIESHEKRAVTARLLENTEIALQQEAEQGTYSISEAVAGTTTASVGNPDPVLISLVRRAMPNLIAYDVAGVQPMSGPTGLIFAMKSRYDDQGGGVTTADTEALFSEADTDYSGAGAHKAGSAGTVALSSVVAGDIVQVAVTAGSSEANWNTVQTGTPGIPAVGAVFTVAAGGTGTGAVYLIGTTGTGMAVEAGEEKAPNGMGFTVEKVTVEAKTRVLQAEYSMELAQDLKAVHGLDAEAELANILSAEILAEINREVIRNINETAKVGSTGAVAGVLTINATNADTGGGRWQAERFQALGFRLEQEANIIAKETRRGKGNFLICSSSVASALSAAGSLAYGAAITGGDLSVDNAGNTFAGTLKNGMKVYVDAYATYDYATVGYKGANSYDAGIYYCPYVPLTMLKAVDAGTFQPKIGFKTRYGLQQNPFAANAAGIGAVGANPYFRRSIVVGV